MVHLNRFDLSGEVGGSEGDEHGRFDDTRLDTAHRDCSNTSNLVHILHLFIDC